MKNTIILFLLFSLSATAQKDTIIMINGQYYHESTREQGASTVITRTLLGETQQEVVNALITELGKKADNYARQAVVFATRDEAKNELQKIAQQVQQITGQSYWVNSQANESLTATILATYQYRKNNTGAQSAQILRLGNGNIRFRINSIDYVVRVISRRWIVVLNYDNNAELHLYWDTENVTWRDITNTYTLRKV